MSAYEEVREEQEEPRRCSCVKADNISSSTVFTTNIDIICLVYLYTTVPRTPSNGQELMTHHAL